MMMDPKDCNREAALEAFSRLLKAVPKNKLATIMNDAIMVECTLNHMANTLNKIRAYFLATMGETAEQSPFVKRIDGIIFVQRIDGIIPRPVPKPG